MTERHMFEPQGLGLIPMVIEQSGRGAARLHQM